MVSLLSDTGELRSRCPKGLALCKDKTPSRACEAAWAGPPRGVCTPALSVARGGLGRPERGSKIFLGHLVSGLGVSLSAGFQDQSQAYASSLQGQSDKTPMLRNTVQ